MVNDQSLISSPLGHCELEWNLLLVILMITSCLRAGLATEPPPEWCWETLPKAAFRRRKPSRTTMAGRCGEIGCPRVAWCGLLAADLRWSGALGTIQPPAEGSRVGQETAPIRLLQSSASPVTIWCHVNTGMENNQSCVGQSSCVYVSMRWVNDNDIQCKANNFISSTDSCHLWSKTAFE